MLRRIWAFLNAPRRLPGAAPVRPRATRGRGERGIALILVLGMLVLMTAFVVEFQFKSNVRYTLAANYRDQVRARYLAQSGINIYRLLVMAIYNVRKSPYVSQMLDGTGIDLGTVLTQVIPQLDTGLLRFMGAGFGAEDVQLDDGGATLKDGAEADDSGGLSFSKPVENSLSQSGSAGFLDFDGDFSTVIEPEDRQINVNMLDTGELDTNPAFRALWGLMADEGYQHLFREKNITPRELIGNLRDWIDADGDVVAGQGGFEDNYYSRLGDPYAAKNTRFTTVSEIHLVKGWDDVFYNLFASKLTVYGSDTINPNNVGPEVMRGLIRAYCTGAAAYSDALIDKALSSEQWLMIKAQVQFADPEQFSQVLSTLGLGDCSQIKPYLGFDTRAYRLTSTGIVGDVQKTIEVVVDNRARPLYWREN